MRAQVGAARQVQLERFKNEPKIFCNAHMESRHLRPIANLTKIHRPCSRTPSKARPVGPCVRPHPQGRARSRTSTEKRKSCRRISPRRYNTGAWTGNCGWGDKTSCRFPVTSYGSIRIKKDKALNWIKRSFTRISIYFLKVHVKSWPP